MNSPAHANVALRKESVDRNSTEPANLTVSTVALRKESVDRNINADVSYSIKRPSLSARRAWIETLLKRCLQMRNRVALRKESVDRNTSLRVLPFFAVVALRKESVDRNQNSGNGQNAIKGSLSARRAWIETEARPFVS